MPDTITIIIPKPKYEIRWQQIYIPQFGGPILVPIMGYDIRVVAKVSGELSGVLRGYFIPEVVFMRRGISLKEVNVVFEKEIYTDRAAAEAASVFKQVCATPMDWRRAIALDSSELGILANDIRGLFYLDKIREILSYCEKRNGLLVHDFNELLKEMHCTEQELKQHLKNNEFLASSLKKILTQLMS